MSTWISKVEELQEAVELNFPPTPAFKPFQQYFTPESIAHPAKANLYLLYFLIKKYTKPGDLVLDPMAGTGSTGVIANILGRNAILIDIEKKFCKWMEDNIKLTEKMGAKGRSIVICGDSRYLSNLIAEHVGKINSIITSPPYGEALKKRDSAFYFIGLEAKKGKYGEDTADDNISNLPHIPAIITSPPYEKTHPIGRRFLEAHLLEIARGNVRRVLSLMSEYAPSPENIGRLGGETYTSAMLKIYGEMFKLLEPGGYAIVIVKAYHRKKEPVDLPYETLVMMNTVGFRLEKIYKLRLRGTSFFKKQYYKKYPNVPVIKHEHVLVMRKP